MNAAVSAAGLGAIIVALVIGAVIAALIEALVLWLLAKFAFKVENAGFGGAFIAALAGVGGAVVVEILLLVIFGISLGLLKALPFIGTVIGFALSTYVLAQKYSITLQKSAIINVVAYAIFLLINLLRGGGGM